MKKKLSNISKKSKMIAATAFVLGLAAVGGLSVNAAETADERNPTSALVTAIAEKFDLNSEEVQSVVDSVMQSQHAEMEAKHKEMFSTRLELAVTAGDLTQEQADLISAKAEELKSSIQEDRESFKDLSDEERKEKMEANRAELAAWAKENGIPDNFLHFVGSGKGLGGPMRHGGFGGMRPAENK